LVGVFGRLIAFTLSTD